MHCHEAQRRLTEIGSTAMAHGEDAALQAHLAECDACARAAEAAFMLQRTFDSTKQQDYEDMPGFDQVKRQVEAGAFADQSEVRGNTSIMAKIWNPLSGRTRWSIGLVTATAVLAFLTVVPFSYERTAGYEVALAGVNKDLAMDEGKIRVLLEKLGVDGATIELGECESTCNLTIADLESRDECKIIVAAMKEMGSCEILNDGSAQFVHAEGVLVELAANTFRFGEDESLSEHQIFEIVTERLGDDPSGTMNIFIAKEGSARFGEIEESFGTTIKGCTTDGHNFAFQCCEEENTECAAVLGTLGLAEGLCGTSGECIVVRKSDDSPAGHINELLSKAGIDLESFDGEVDNATFAKLAEMGLSIVIVDAANGNLNEVLEHKGTHENVERMGDQKLHEADDAAAAKAGVIPEGYALHQNYPNPFNPQTTISFTLAQSERVRIDIVNMMGQTVRTLKDQTMSAGPHDVVWDATSATGTRVPSGTYMYRIEAGEFVATRSMTLLK